MKKNLVNAKNFVVAHKIEIITIVTATAVVYGMRIGIHQHNEFLREHDLYDAFYTPED